MKIIITILLVVQIAGCSFIGKNKVFDKKIEIINMGDNFQLFLNEAKNKSLAQKIQIWNKIIESPHQSFYDSLVWEKKYNENWKQLKIERLEVIFKNYEKNSDDILNNFKNFNSTLENQILFFKRQFPDFEFQIPAYAALAPTIYGKAGFVNGRYVLAFGVDLISIFLDGPDIIYSHELFHVYHLKFLDFTNGYSEEKFSLPLWMEGLATYVMWDT